MKKEDLFHAFGNINDDLIENSEISKKNKPVKFTDNKFINYISITVCLVLIVISTTILPNVFISKPQDDTSYSNPSLNNSFVGIVDRLENINVKIVAYITPNIDESLSEYNKFIEIPLNTDQEFSVGNIVVVYYNEILDINEYIHFTSSIIEKK